MGAASNPHPYLTIALGLRPTRSYSPLARNPCCIQPCPPQLGCGKGETTPSASSAVEPRGGPGERRVSLPSFCARDSVPRNYLGKISLIEMDSSDDVLVQITVGGKQYTSWNFGFEIPRGIFPTPSNGAPYLPATLIKGPVDSTEEEAGQFAASIFAHDDVWNEGFLKGVVQQPLMTPRSTNTVPVVLLVVRPNKNEMTIKYADANILEKVPIDNAAMISNGPYLIDTASGKVHTVARLFDDPFHAFLGGGIKYDPSTKKYRSLHINVLHSPSLACYWFWFTYTSCVAIPCPFETVQPTPSELF